MLTHEAIRRSDKDTNKKPIKIGKLITIGGIINEFETFNDTLQEDQIESIHNFASYKDWVVKYQPIFGRSGFYGFVKSRKDKNHYFIPHKGLEIKNYRFNLKHSEYFNDSPPNFYIIWSSLLRMDIKT